METSGGRCFSKAAISGDLHEVWPPAMAPSFVARRSGPCQIAVAGKGEGEAEAFTTGEGKGGGRTWAVLGYHGINDGSFDAVHDVVACASHQVTVA